MTTGCKNESCKYNSDGECYYDRGLDHDEQGRCVIMKCFTTDIALNNMITAMVEQREIQDSWGVMDEQILLFLRELRVRRSRDNNIANELRMTDSICSSIHDEMQDQRELLVY